MILVSLPRMALSGVTSLLTLFGPGAKEGRGRSLFFLKYPHQHFRRHILAYFSSHLKRLKQDISLQSLRSTVLACFRVWKYGMTSFWTG